MTDKTAACCPADEAKDESLHWVSNRINTPLVLRWDAETRRGTRPAEAFWITTDGWRYIGPASPDDAVALAEAQAQIETITHHHAMDIEAAGEEIANLRAQVAALTEALEEAQSCLEGEPEYHIHGMGCGLEDRDITDRYEAMEHGWEQAMERVYGEHINGAREVICAALAQSSGGEVGP